MTECSFFGKDAKLHHVGMAVSSIQNLSPSSEIVINEQERVSMAFIRVGDIRIELLEPLGGDSPITRSMQKGVKLLHLCYEVPDLEAALETCRPAGFHRLSAPATIPVFENRRVVWVFSNQYGLFELCGPPYQVNRR